MLSKESLSRTDSSKVPSRSAHSSPAAWRNDGLSNVSLATRLFYLKLDITNGFKKGIDFTALKDIATEERKQLMTLNNDLVIRNHEIHQKLSSAYNECDVEPLKHYSEVERALASTRRQKAKFEESYRALMGEIDQAFKILEEKDNILEQIDALMEDLQGLKMEGLQLFGDLPDKKSFIEAQDEEYQGLSDELKYQIYATHENPVAQQEQDPWTSMNPPPPQQHQQQHQQQGQMYLPPLLTPIPVAGVIPAPQMLLLTPEKAQNHPHLAPLTHHLSPQELQVSFAPVPMLHQRQLIAVPTVPVPFSPSQGMSPQQLIRRDRVLLPPHLIGSVAMTRQCPVPLSELPPREREEARRWLISQGIRNPNTLMYGDWSPAPQNIVALQELQRLEITTMMVREHSNRLARLQEGHVHGGRGGHEDHGQAGQVEGGRGGRVDGGPGGHVQFGRGGLAQERQDGESSHNIPKHRR